MVPLPARTPGLIALTAIVIFFSFAQSNSSFAAVLNVPSEFAIIQEAIDAAENGDEIIVAPGTYVENLRMNGKNVNLHSIDPTDWSVVDSTILHGGFRTNVITFDGSENETCRVAGFKITEGGFLNSTFREQGSGIWGGDYRTD